MNKLQTNIKTTIIQLLSSLANPKEIEQYLKRFASAGQSQFAVIKVGGSILQKDMQNLCSSLAFLQQIGLFPIVIHGAGPQLSANLQQANIKTEFIDGQRVTSAKVLEIAKQTFIQESLKFANHLQALDVHACSIPSGVFYGERSAQELGYVGEITKVNLNPIHTAIEGGSVPILSSIAESSDGQTFNINADVATNQLAISLKPYKIIFLTETGGLLDNKGEIISSVNLITDYDDLMQQDWLHGGMRLKIKQVAEILSYLPATASVSITKPAYLAKELFTHKGSGTLIRRGESIMLHTTLDTIKQKKLKKLLEQGFNKKLTENYFDSLDLHQAYITYCYRSAAIVIKPFEIPFLDKFVVADEAKGEGLGKAVWARLTKENPQFFLRCRPENPINQFYFTHTSGCYKTKEWNIFWYGITELAEIKQCIDYALTKEITLT